MANVVWNPQVGEKPHAANDEVKPLGSRSGSKPGRTSMRVSQIPTWAISGVKANTDEKRVSLMRLCYAASEGLQDQVKQMLEKRADPNARDYDQKTALHVAASHGQTESVKLLLEYKAEPNVIDIAGQTPLMEAEARDHWNLVKTLQDAGAHLMRESLLDAAQRERWFIGRSEVQLHDVLSETLKSTVIMGDWRGTQVCAKFAKVQEGDHTSDEDLLDELLHEIELVAQLRHPDLVMFLGASLEERKVMFITEFMPGGDLERFYMNKRMERNGDVWRPKLAQLVRWASGVARALSFLHGAHRPIIHRDLKPLNLLLSGDCKDCKITDFGISKLVHGHKNLAQMPTTQKMTGGVGSWRYMAPEVVRYESYTDRADIYSFALILFFMSSGMDPFHEMGRDAELVLKEYISGKEPRPKVTECHAELRPILSAGWAIDANKRPSAFDMIGLLADVNTDAKCIGCKTM